MTANQRFQFRLHDLLIVMIIAGLFLSTLHSQNINVVVNVLCSSLIAFMLGLTLTFGCFRLYYMFQAIRGEGTWPFQLFVVLIHWTNGLIFLAIAIQVIIVAAFFQRVEQDGMNLSSWIMFLPLPFAAYIGILIVRRLNSNSRFFVR